MEKYDLVVIGSGPAGEKAAVKAAYFGRRVALVEKELKLGGGGVNWGSLPALALKETALQLSDSHKSFFSLWKEKKSKSQIADFFHRKNETVSACEKQVQENLKVHGVELYHGEATFDNANTIIINGKKQTKICTDNVIIATGTYAYHPDNIPFDAKNIYDSDTILEIESVPESLCIYGGGHVAWEYATIFAVMGTKVSIIYDECHFFTYLDEEISEAFQKECDALDMQIYKNEKLVGVTAAKDEDGQQLIRLESKKTLKAKAFLYAALRKGNTESLGLEKIAIRVDDETNIISVNEEYRTSIPHVFAVGDVIGHPALASVAMDQGRVAVSHMFDTLDIDHISTIYPMGVHTIPEVSKIGLTEAEAKEQGLDFAVGRAYFTDMPRAKILEIKYGMMKIIFGRVNLEILGVHIFGPLALELIHYGATLVEKNQTMHYLVGQVFNYPSLHELYKYAAYDGLSNLSGYKLKKSQEERKKQ